MLQLLENQYNEGVVMDKNFIRCLGVCLLLGSLTAGTGSQAQDAEPYTGEIQTGYVNVEDGKLFYEVAGDGDWMVLIHDGLVHRETWNGQFLEFANEICEWADEANSIQMDLS